MMPRPAQSGAQPRQLLRQLDRRRRPAPALSLVHQRLASSSPKKAAKPAAASTSPDNAASTSTSTSTNPGNAASSTPSAPPTEGAAQLPSRRRSARLSEQFAQYQAERRAPTQAETSAAGEDEASKAPPALSFPLGVGTPPAVGENSGVDARDFRQRRDDLFDWDKHLARRRDLTAQIAKPYFRDWTNMQHRQGKVFVAPERIFRADRARFFPNLRGVTAAAPSQEADTTPALAGRISLVAVFTGTWAQRQTQTFLGSPAVARMLAAAERAAAPPDPSPSLPASSAQPPTPPSSSSSTMSTTATSQGPLLQLASLNIEQQSRMRYALVRLFLGRTARALREGERDRYFLVRRGLGQRLREQLGMFNAHVGYVFLLDPACRVRWAGCADADAQEAASLQRAVARVARETLAVAHGQAAVPRGKDVSKGQGGGAGVGAAGASGAALSAAVAARAAALEHPALDTPAVERGVAAIEAALGEDAAAS